MSTLPSVDFRAFASGDRREQDRFVQTFGDGLRTYGFGVVAEHPLSSERIARSFERCERLFALPEEAKRRCIVPESKGNRGYVPFGGEKALGARVADLKEFWHLGQSDPQWGLLPNAWPRELQEVQQEFEALFRTFESTAQTLLRAIARYLDEPEDYFASMTVGGDSVLRLLHYPPIPGQNADGAVRAGAHEDINLLTLLAEGTTGGLELLERNGTWMPVHSLRGQLVINAGDMLQHLTHGYLRSTTHRVSNPSGPNVSRYSMPFFTHPRPDVLLRPSAPAPDYQGPAFAPITAGAFLAERLAAIQTT